MSQYRARALEALRKIRQGGWGVDAIAATTGSPTADDLAVVFVTRRQAACLIAYLAKAAGDLSHLTAEPFEAAAADAYELAVSIGEQVFGPAEEPTKKEDA